MYENPAQFTHYVALTPSALWTNENLSEIDSQYSLDNLVLDAHVYITHETDEHAPYVEAIQRYIQQIRTNDYEGLNLSLASVEGMRHSTMTSEGFVRGIAWAFSDIRPKGPSTFARINIEASLNCESLQRLLELGATIKLTL